MDHVRTAAILPIKRFAEAKQRLGQSVADPLRRDLARAMVADVLFALSRSRLVENTIVVTREEEAKAAAGAHGAIVVLEESESGQSAAVALGVQRALAEGFQRVLCVPGDCPALDPAELDDLLAPARPSTEVVVLPDRHGTGTNGLLLSPPDAIAPSFGPDSCERHRGLAVAAGVCWRVQPVRSMLLDIDTGDDLSALRSRLAGEDAWAARTREVLGTAGAVSIKTPA